MQIPIPAHEKFKLEAAIALGSNLGDRLSNLRQAARMLQQELGTRGLLSSIYETKAMDCPDPRPFLNAIAIFHTHWSPEQLLHLCWHIEQRAGRKRTYINAPRILDLDLIYLGKTQMQTSQLTLPHPRMTQRLFVLQPLAELRPHWKHPRLDSSISDLISPLRRQESEPSVVSTPLLWEANSDKSISNSNQSVLDLTLEN